MKRNLQIKSSIKFLLVLGIICVTFLQSCKKNSDVPATVKEAKFSADVNGTAASGNSLLEESYTTTNDEFLGTAYTELHISGSNTILDIMIANPSVKQYNVGAANAEAGLVLNVNGTLYEATSNTLLNITEATDSKISGTFSGTLKNINTTATVQVNNGSFTAQF
jgi:hypothetical protein